MSAASIAREDALSPPPTRRAQRVLFSIELLVSRLAADARIPAELLTDLQAGNGAAASLETYALAREPHSRPNIQDLELFARRWRTLVPADARVRAVMAHELALRYRFTASSIPSIRAALGLDTGSVRAAFEDIYRLPLGSIFSPGVGLVERLRWAAATPARALEALPPFWAASIMILSLSLSQAVLALPIAAAAVGPLPAIGLIAAVGAVSVVTMAQMAETFARHGGIRYGTSFLGRVVADFLGDSGSAILTGALTLRMGLCLVAAFIGIASTAASVTPVPPTVWAFVLLLLAPYLLAGKRLNFTTGLSVLFGATSVALVLVLAGVALTHVRLSNLTFVDVPVLSGSAFTPVVLQAVVGVVIQVYLGQSYLIQVAKAVLPRDPSGSSLIRASIASTVAMVVLLSLWVLSVNGALPSAALAGNTGTVLVPLAQAFGPAVGMLSAPLVLFLLGLSYLRQATMLVGFMRERLPASLGRFGQRGTFWASLTPLLAIFLVTEGLYFTRSDSYTGLVSFSGLLTNSLIVGIFPPLLLVASRRKGDIVPRLKLRWLSNPLAVVGVYALFVAILIVHGTLIWPGPLERGSALAVATIAIAGTAVMMKRGAFTRRTVVELRMSAGGPTTGSIVVTDGGEACAAQIALAFDSAHIDQLGTGITAVPGIGRLQAVTCELPASPACELKIWAHELTDDGSTHGLSALIEIREDGHRRSVRPSAAGEVIVSRTGVPCAVRIELVLELLASTVVEQLPVPVLVEQRTL